MMLHRRRSTAAAPPPPPLGAGAGAADGAATSSFEQVRRPSHTPLSHSSVLTHRAPGFEKRRVGGVPGRPTNHTTKGGGGDLASRARQGLLSGIGTHTGASSAAPPEGSLAKRAWWAP